MGAASWPVRVPLSKADVPLAAMNVRLRPLSRLTRANHWPVYEFLL